MGSGIFLLLVLQDMRLLKPLMAGSNSNLSCCCLHKFHYFHKNKNGFKLSIKNLQSTLDLSGNSNLLILYDLVVSYQYLAPDKVITELINLRYFFMGLEAENILWSYWNCLAKAFPMSNNMMVQNEINTNIYKKISWIFPLSGLFLSEHVGNHNIQTNIDGLVTCRSKILNKTKVYVHIKVHIFFFCCCFFFFFQE